MTKITVEQINDVVQNDEELFIDHDEVRKFRVCLVENYRTGGHCIMVSIMNTQIGYAEISLYYPTSCVLSVIDCVENFNLDDSWGMHEIAALEIGLYPVAYRSHYDYLEFVIDRFWPKVFGKTRNEMFCGCNVGAHADKCDGYKFDWNDAGIPFYHGVLLFLLTYTKLMDRPKHESGEWVIENYEKFNSMIFEAEDEFLDEIGKKANKGSAIYVA